MIPGPIALFGSGETSPIGRKVFDEILRSLGKDAPLLALLETPAGFELNSAQVIARLADFLRLRLQNYHPQVQAIPARARSTPFSPDNPEIVAPLLDADLLFMGPGSPTYAVRQLRDSLAWQYIIARHRLGAALVLASAAAIAFSACALPVYEIYKTGEDLHWKDGLNFFGLYGLPLVFVPHWNNNDGGENLDTSRCFMGQSRFAQLMAMLPSGHAVVGLDEKTALLIEPQTHRCRVLGLGGVTVLHTGHSHRNLSASGEGLEEIAAQRNGHVHQYRSGETFSLDDLGPFKLYRPEAGLPADVWQRALERARQPASASQPEEAAPPPEIAALLAARQEARKAKDWPAADRLRSRILALGWELSDTPNGPALTKLAR